MKHLFIFFFLMSCMALQLNAQLIKQDTTSTDKIPKHSKYIEYWDDDSTIVGAKGHYCNNNPCKTWKYYHPNGIIRMKVKYADRMKIKYYTRDRKLDQKGYAILDLDSGAPHFYWQGLWKFYDDRRRLYRVARFDKGVEVEILSGPAKAIYYE